MNKKGRVRLKKNLLLAETLADDIESLKDSEKDALDNIPENLQGGDLYKRIESAIDELDDAESNIRDAIRSLESALNS